MGLWCEHLVTHEATPVSQATTPVGYAIERFNPIGVVSNCKSCATCTVVCKPAARLSENFPAHDSICDLLVQ